MPVGAMLAVLFVFIVLIIVTVASQAGATNTARSHKGHLLTIHDRGKQTVALSQAATVGDALKEADVAVDKSDNIEPAASEKLVASEYQINIYRARPVIVVDGTTRQKIITPYQTANQIAASAGVTLYIEDTTTLSHTENITSEGAGLQLTIDRATPFAFTLYGKTATARTQGKTIGDMLKEKKITLTKDDRVSPDQSTIVTEGMAVRVWREGKQTVTVDEPVTFPIQQIQDGDQEVGYRAVRTAGVNGAKQVTYEVVIQDGLEVKRTEIASLTTTEPIAQIEVIGTKSRFSSSLNQWLSALRTCETSGNYRANTGNGFHGAYQFMIGTWNSTASKANRPDLIGVSPESASPGDQDAMIVINTNLSRGGLASQNPGCYSKLGLAQFPPA